MARIGIFIDALQGSIPISFRESITAFIQGLPNIAFCIEEESLTSSEGLDRMAKRLEAGGADRIVIVGGSPKHYEASFHKWGYCLPFNPYLFAIANVREQALWPMADENAAIIKFIGTMVFIASPVPMGQGTAFRRS